MSSSAALVVEAVSKVYGESYVLDDVSLCVERGEVRALLGENGAGKSTLIKIISGAVAATSGLVSVGGAPGGAFPDPRSALQGGVATLHQELQIVPGLSVAENVMLGRGIESTLGFVRWRRLERDAAAVFGRLGYPMNVRRDVALLSPIEQTMTALARALTFEARLLILDEPTAALTDSEARRLFEAIRRAAELGTGVLYVSHRLEEVFEIADSYTVLRNGRIVDGGQIADTSITDIITAMAGRSISAIFPDRAQPYEDAVLAVRNLTGRRVRGLTFDLREGEIVGIAGLAGSGRSESLRLMAGASRAVRGQMTLRGRPVRFRSPAQAHRAGVVYLPEERRSDGLVPASVERNLNLTTLNRHVSVPPLVSTSAARAHAADLWQRFGVRGRSPSQDVLTLSGGNQQKVVLAKYLALNPTVVLLDEPTRGVDVGTKSEIYQVVKKLGEGGAGVVVVSSDLTELTGLCHRIIVLHEGSQVADYAHDSFHEHRILEACYGGTST